MTVTLIDVEVDNHVLDALDFSHDTPCDECEEPAKFILTMKCCGKVYLACEDCLYEAVNYFKKFPKGVITRCSTCKAKHMGFPYLIEALDKND